MFEYINRLFTPKNMDIQEPTFNKAPVHSQSVARWLWFFIKPFKVRFTLLSINRLIRHAFFIALQPLIIAKIVEAFETGAAFENNQIVWHWFFVYAGVSATIYFMLLFCIMDSRLSDKISRQLSLFGLNHLMKLSVSWHELIGSGSKFQKIQTARNASYQLLDNYFRKILALIAAFLGTAISLSAMDVPWLFTGLFALFISSYTLFSWYSGEYLTHFFARYNESMEHLASKVYEFVNSISTIKMFNLQSFISTRAQEGESDAYKKMSDIFNFDFSRWVIINFIALFWIILILGLAAKQVLNKEMTISAFTLLSYLCFSIWTYMEEFTSIYSKFIEYRNGISRLIHILRQPIPSEEMQNDTKLKIEKGEVNFKDVSFSYNEDAPVFNGLNIHIKAGEKVGVVGRSGSGKSTLVKLLLRFYSTNNQEITIDGQNISQVSQESLRQNIAIIPQETALFNHSLMENIRYGRLDASDEEVMQASKLAHAHEFIRELPNGYGTIVGERGARLSGGQRQRIAIARAILKNAPILILDEATSALDTESERLIQESLDSLMENKTVIAIAHRLSTIAHLDRLLVFDHGKLVEEGSHDELIKKNGYYAKLWRMQSREGVLE